MTTDMDKLADALSKLSCALKLERKVVGVKMLFDEEELERAKASKLKTRMPYCVMVKTAMAGKSIKAVIENFGCLASARALGIAPVDETASSGRHFRRLGLYRDLTTAKNVQKNMSICLHKALGVMIKPLEEYDEAPDVALIVSTPYNAMRIVQGYTHAYGCNASYKMVGNQAICSECTAYPFESNNINVSLMCSGTRRMAGWGDEEMAIGLPFCRFLPVVDGVYRTLNPTEPNEKKAEIESRLKEHGRTDLQVEFDKNYYTGLYLR